MKKLKKLQKKLLAGTILLGVMLMQISCSGTRMYSESTAHAYIDPVCGTTVKADTELQYEYEGRIYYFGSAECLAVFKQNPARFTQNQNRHHGHMGMNRLGWWGPALGVIMVVGMVGAMMIGVNH